MSRHTFCIAFIACGCLMSLAHAGADDTSRGRKLAVVVGNNEYRPNQGLDKLGQAINDAHKLSAALRQAGFTVIEMTHDVAKEPGQTLLAPNADYIRDQIDAVIDAPNLGRDDTVLISLHGHGVQFDLEETVTKNGKTETKKTARFYFCPADTSVLDAKGEKLKRANDITERNHLLALDELYQKLEGCTAATKLLIVDACRNDPSRPTNARDLASVTLPKLPPPPGGIAAFFSCKANQRAMEDPDLGQGVFTHFLIQGLSGKADQPLEGAPADGIVTLSELTSYVSNNTYSYVLRKYPGVKQSPDMKGEYDTNLPVVRLPKEKSLPKEITSKSTGMKLTLIPAGTFQMGSPASEAERLTSEGPQHSVRISQPFYMGVYEVTQAEYESVMGTNPSSFSKTGTSSSKVSGMDTGKFPVETVSWDDAQEFCRKLSVKDGQTYRLPTEAEWEYACRANTTTPFHFGGTLNGDKANVDGNFSYGTTTKGKYLGRTTTVGSYSANAFGLYDMHGNVWEWCEDAYDELAYGKRSGTTSDPKVTTGSEGRVLRGGSWGDNSKSARSADRYRFTPGYRDDVYGFRVVLSSAAVRTP